MNGQNYDRISNGILDFVSNFFQYGLSTCIIILIKKIGKVLKLLKL